VPTKRQAATAALAAQADAYFAAFLAAGPAADGAGPATATADAARGRQPSAPPTRAAAQGGGGGRRGGRRRAAAAAAAARCDSDSDSDCDSVRCTLSNSCRRLHHSPANRPSP
jgi:hypothetical protein